MYIGHFANSVIDSWGTCSDENDKPGAIPSILMWYAYMGSPVITMIQKVNKQNFKFD